MAKGSERVGTPALWTKHRGIAHAIAAGYRIPGADHQDVVQEALIALWEACRCHDPAKGPFPPFARLVINRRLCNAVKIAGRKRKREVYGLGLEAQAPEHENPLPELLHGFARLTEPEQQAIRDVVNGEPLRSKRDDNTRYAARRKLRLLAEPA